MRSAPRRSSPYHAAGGPEGHAGEQDQPARELLHRRDDDERRRTETEDKGGDRRGLARGHTITHCDLRR